MRHCYTQNRNVVADHADCDDDIATIQIPSISGKVEDAGRRSQENEVETVHHVYKRIDEIEQEQAVFHKDVCWRHRHYPHMINHSVNHTDRTQKQAGKIRDVIEMIKTGKIQCF
jgi:hypothetical protein